MSVLSRALWRDTWRRPGQVISVGVVIALGVALFAASFDAFLNLTASYERIYEEQRLADVTAIGGPTDAVAAAGAAVDGVEAVATRSVADVPLEPRADHTLLGRVIGMPPDGEPAVDGVRIVRGENLDPSRPDAVVVERRTADHFGLEPGDSIRVSTPSGWQDRQVVGIAVSPEYLWLARSRQELLALPDDFGVVFAPESFVQGLSPGAVHREALFRLASDAPGDTAERLEQAVKTAGAADTFTKAEQPSNAALQEDVAGFAELSVMFPALFLAAAAFATYVMLGRMVAVQQANIGTLRAFGYTGRSILRRYALIGILLGLAGAIVGVIAGALLAEVVTRLYTGTLGIPAAVVEVRPATIGVGLLTGVLTGLVAAALPARQASRITPASAMRGPLPPGHGGRSVLERIVPPLGRLPVRWLATVRSLGRARRRSLATIVGVVMATMLVLVSWGMVDTVQILLDQQFVRIQRNDAVLYVTGRSTNDVASDVEAVDGVAAVEPAIIVPVALSKGDASYSTTLTALEPDSQMHELVSTDGATLAVPSDGIVMGSSLQGLLDLSVGDTVDLTITGVGTVDAIPVVGFVDEPLGTYAYTSISAAEALADRAVGELPASADLTNALFVGYEAGVDRPTMRSAISAIAGVEAYVDARGLYELAQDFMGLFYAFVGVMIVLGGILAFALIYNTMSANVTERATELAVLRTLGLSRRAIGGLVTGQNLLLTLIGLVPGLLVGWATAAVFMASFSSDMFTFDLRVRPTTFLFTAGAILLVGVLSQYPALRAVGRLDLGRIVRDRSF